MKLSEALKSGKRFRRTCETSSEWFNPSEIELETGMFSINQILAEDWELERDPEIVEIKLNGIAGQPLLDLNDWYLIQEKRWKAVCVEIIE